MMRKHNANPTKHNATPEGQAASPAKHLEEQLKKAAANSKKYSPLSTYLAEPAQDGQWSHIALRYQPQRKTEKTTKARI